MNKKLFALGILLFFSIFYTYSQNKADYWKIDSLDRFNEATMPISDGLTMWITRQKLTINGIWVYMNTEVPTNTKNYRMHLETFLPVYQSKHFSAGVGIKHNKSYSLANQNSDFNKTFIHNWFFGAVQYNKNAWRISLSAEYYFNGDKNSFYTQQGNRFMPLLLVGYAFNNRWQLIGFGGYNLIYNETDKIQTPIMGGQLRYQPNSNFKVIVGAPVIFATEFTIAKKIDFFYRFFMTKESQAYIRYTINERFSLSINYNNNYFRTNEAYFIKETIMNDNEQFTYNLSKQLQHPIRLEFAIKTNNNFAFILTGGYNIGGDIILQNDKIEVSEIKGGREYFMGLQLNYLIFH